MDLEFFDFEIFDLEESEDHVINGPENADIMLVIEESDFEVHKSLISNIMGAIKYDLDKEIRVCLLCQAQKLNLARTIVSDSVKVIVFGISPKQVSMNASFKAYHLYPTESFKIMFSHSLEALNANKTYKKALWTELQNSFIKNG